MSALLAVLASASAVAVLVRRGPRGPVLGPPPRPAAATRSPRRARRLPPRVGLAAGAALGACLLAAGAGWVALVVGLVAAFALRAVLARAEPAETGAARAAVAAELPWALDLLAAAGAAGAAPADGVAAVADSLGGSELGRRLAATAAQLRLGAAPAEAWATALADGGEALAPVCEAYAAAAADGSHLAARLAGQAAAAREQQGAAALGAAERAGVRSVLPLGLCHLPAFVLVGIVPVVAAALHRL